MDELDFRVEIRAIQMPFMFRISIVHSPVSGSVWCGGQIQMALFVLRPSATSPSSSLHSLLSLLTQAKMDNPVRTE